MSYRRRNRTGGSPLVREWSWQGVADAIQDISPRKASWYGNASAAEIRRIMLDGDKATAAEAERSFDRALEAVLPNTEGGRTKPMADVIGSRVCVGDFLADAPRCMRRRKKSPRMGPVRIFVDITTSAACSAKVLAARGVAVAALAYAVQMIRPVELFALVAGSYGRDVVNYVPIGLKPLDLSRVAAAVSHVGLARRMYEISETHVVGWPKAPVRKTLQLGEHDIYVQPIHCRRESEVLSDPMGWLLADLAKQKENAALLWGGKDGRTAPRC